MMNKLMMSAVLIMITSAALYGQASSSLWVTAYYQDYGVCAMPPAQVDFSALTHIIYFHTDVDVNVAPYFLPVVSAAESTRIEWSNSSQGCARTSGESYQAELLRRGHAANVKVLLCVGGIYGAGATRMGQIASDSVKTQTWANSLIAYLIRKGFDGIDLDWEFPQNQTDYMRMLRILRRGLDSMPARGVFTAAVYGDANSSAYDYPNLKYYLDQVNCMTYDMWNNQNTVWLNSPLGKAAGSPSAWRTWRASSALSWAKKGVPKNILANGIPFYSWKFTGVTALGQPLAGYNYGEFSDAANALAGGGTYHWDDSAKAPWVTITNGGVNTLITYDDTNSVKYKVQRTKDDGIGGVMIYGLWDGWLSSAPAGKKDALLQAVKSANGGTFVPPPTTAAPTLNSPADGATGAATSTTFNWNVASGVTSSEIQISTNSAFSAIAVDQGAIVGTSYLAGSLSNATTYFWRVNATSSNGTSAWSAVRSLTTIAGAPSAPAAPSLLSPAQGALNIVLSPDLRWRTAPSATTYRLQLATSSSFSAPVVDQSSITDTLLHVTNLSYSTVYYWRVVASNAIGTGAWSAASDFTTADSVIVSTSVKVFQDTIGTAWRDNSWNATVTYGSTERVYEGTKSIRVDQNAWGGLSMHNGPWGSPVNMNPADYARVEFAVNGGATGAQISVLLANDASETFPTVSYGTVPANQWAYISLPMNQLDPSGHMINRVGILEVAGTTKTYFVDDIRLIGNGQVSTLLAAALVSPANAAVNQIAAAPLRWNASAGATSYRLQVSTSATFASLQIYQSALTDTTFTPSTLSDNTTYYWRVSASDASGTSPWSSVWSFTTQVSPVVAPAPPPLGFPAGGASNVSTTTSLQWNRVASASSYHVQVSGDSSYGSFFLDQNGVTDTTLAVTGLANSTTYYWRVDATNTAGTSPWSATRSLTTKASGLAFAASPSSMNFGKVGIGQWKKDSLTITNQGSVSLTVTQVQATLPQYNVISNVGALAPGNSAKVFITFAPSQRITYDDKIAIVINSGNSSDTVFVTGKGVNPAHLRHGSANVNLGNVPTEVLTSDTVMVYNDGELDLNIANIQSTNAVFNISPLQAVIAPADSMRFIITAHPTTSGMQDGYFFFDNNGVGTPDTLHVQIDNATGIGDPPATPSAFLLRQNYPNPFNPSTTISFDLATPAVVFLKIYNSLGQEVATLYDGQQLDAGTKTAVFHADALPSGIYYYGLRAQGVDLAGILKHDVSIAQMKKMILIK